MTSRLSNSDLAILEFKSETIYQVAAIGDTSRLTGGNAVYISGDLYLDETQIHQLAEGQLTDTAISSHRARLEYTNVTTRPMRGGLVLDDKGDLVGIHLNAGSGIPIYVPKNSKLYWLFRVSSACSAKYSGNVVEKLWLLSCRLIS
ncbi:trypsin-like peptidase domain-containing protein [Coleofasciculus sp. C1-SOL-03]|uniref:trypsin-like peptidase domain-containing protein n=1 Tax=Coleofasciculus sp. C1-SOL-03 TaxID=3069522 RepID=UPI004063F050